MLVTKGLLIFMWFIALTLLGAAIILWNTEDEDDAD
jgi:hypothetical protein